MMLWLPSHLVVRMKQPLLQDEGKTKVALMFFL